MLKKLILLVSITIYGFAASGAPALVNTKKVVKGVVNPLEEFIGTLRFSQSSQLASETNGVVKKINFESGDRVKKGDILVSVDSDILDAQITSARVSLKDAKKDFERYEVLKEKNSISQKAYDSSYLQYIKAKSTLDEMLIQKRQKSIKSPFDGVIVEKHIDVGEWLSSGKTVFTVVNTSKVDLMFNLPTSYVYKLDRNAKYSVKIGDKELYSKLYAAIAKGDTRTRTFPVKFKADVKNMFLYDGMEAKISLPRSKKITSLIVPRDAVIKRFGGNVVFINSDSKALMLPVKVVGYEKNNVAVEAQGLTEGMDVVVKGNERIFPNQPLKSLNK